MKNYNIFYPAKVYGLVLTCCLLIVPFGSALCWSQADKPDKVEKLKEKLAEHIGRVPYAEDGTQTYFVFQPSKAPKAIFLSMQGSAGCLFGQRGPIQSEEDLITNGGPSPFHPSIMIQGIPAWTENNLKVILPNCPDVDHSSLSEDYASAINKIIAKENPKSLRVFIGGMSRGTIRSTNVAARLAAGIRGTILLSTSTSSTHDGTVFDPPIKNATSAFLMVIHGNDGCSSSKSLSMLEDFSGALAKVKDKTIVKVTGGVGARRQTRHSLCGARSHHGMNGIHEDVFKIMHGWINKRL